MTSKTSRVSARVPEELLLRLEDVIERESIGSISECVRLCIEEFIALKTGLHSTEKVVVDIGQDILSDIDNLVDIGRISSREEAYKHAIKSWAESQVEKYYIGRQQYLDAVAQTKNSVLESRNRRHYSSR